MHEAAFDTAVWFGFLHLDEIARCSGCSKAICDLLLPPVVFVRYHLLRQAQIRAEHRELKAFYGGRDPDSFISDSDSS